jgi:predicted enzyme related to lactoylglutathione lyase
MRTRLACHFGAIGCDNRIGRQNGCISISEHQEVTMSQGIQLVVYPVKDLAQAKALYSQWLGVKPYVDGPYYVGYRIGDQEIGLDPNGHRAGQTGPLGYCYVDDIQKALQGLLDAGGQAQQAVRDVGGGRLIATVKDADGNLIGLIQNP